MEHFTFTITYDPVTGRDDETVRASYHRPSDLGDFIEFKDREHAIVFAVRSAHVVSIRRTEETADTLPAPSGPLEAHLHFAQR